MGDGLSRTGSRAIYRGLRQKKEAAARRRVQAQADYVEDFFGAVLAFLAFHENYADLGHRLARAVTDHATPVGSSKVARTKRIPIEQRAEAAVIAWMRHSTTAYESMVIPRVRASAEKSGECWPSGRRVAGRYRRGEPVPEGCPLEKALSKGDSR